MPVWVICCQEVLSQIVGEVRGDIADVHSVNVYDLAPTQRLPGSRNPALIYETID